MNTAMGYIAAAGGLVVVIAMAVIGWVSYRLGKGNAEKKQAKSETERLAENADIASQPFVDDPVSGMCKKD